MFKQLAAVFGIAALMVGITLADEVKGKIKKVDTDKNTLTITVNDKDQTFDLTKDAKIVALYGKKLKKAQQQDVPGGLSSLKEGTAVTLTTEKKDSKDQVVQVKLDELQAKKKKGT